MMKHLLIIILTAMACTAAEAQDTSTYPYLGKYKFPDGSVVPGVEVTISNGMLTMSSTAGVSTLTLLRADSFNIAGFNGYAVFRRNEARKVVTVHIEASGYTLEGPKDTSVVSIHVPPGILFPERIYSNRKEAAQALSVKRSGNGRRRQDEPVL